MEMMLEKLEFYGYVLLFFSSFGGSVLAIISAGALAYLGKLDLLWSIVIASCGNICGSIILVCLARYQRKFFRSKKYSRKIALVYLWLKKYGILLIFANKYIYGFKSILPLAVGVSGYSLRKFIIWNGFASFLWGATMGMLGFFASSFAIKVFEKWKQYPYILPLVFIVILLLLWCLIRTRSTRRGLSKQ